ncbi:DNA-binding protein BIN4 [Hondaea fermentalgiana]|uniref:DNA-binding protein BIN4 n=1 Tax=Hondaea fermentalgiana TaxID=2315210 RepID=A0A2R5GVZ2_9STRA|nr:DNA-binding protein BIN4 [Hondaea fermentalgiana]|eukprot:GBG32094.1 DNA-binding protein BIN4 [Hondaea fermentalgiana]
MSAPNDGESGPGSVAKSEPRADSERSDLYHGSSTQDTAVSARSAAAGKSTDDVDTRHEKGETQPGSEDSLPLIFPKRLDARKTGATMPVLLELHGKDINVRGDSGAIGRVSLIDPQGESGEQQQEGISASGKRKTPKKTKRGPSKKAKLLAAAQRYTEGSVLRIDLKGDVYNGVMVPSGVTLLGVAMQKDKVQVQGVWNEFMQCTFKGSVMDGMDGKVA